MSVAMDFARLKSLQPAEAVAYMAGRELVGETFSAYDLWHEEHGRAFTVSRLARADLLEALQQSLARSVKGDLGRRDWIRSTEKLLQDAGWWGTKEVTDPRTGELLTTRFDHARLQLIFDTNVRQAQAGGQWQRMLRNRRTHPFARYVSMDDGRVRPLHRAWHGVTLPLDDAWWATHRPPNGWRCRCRVVGVTQQEYEQGQFEERGNLQDGDDGPLQQRPMRKQAPQDGDTEWRNPATGQVQRIARGIDPGFDYNAGTTGRSAAFEAMVQAKLARLSPQVAKAVMGAGIRATVLDERTLQWYGLVDQVADTMRATGQTVQVHVIDAATVQALRDKGIELQDTAVWMRDQELLHAIRDKKDAREATLPVDVWRDLPRLLEVATPYLDTRDTALIYAIDLGARWGKLVVRVNYNEKGRFNGKRSRIVSNFVQTGGLVDVDNITSEAHMVPLRERE